MGGIVGSLVSVTIFPVSTKHLIEQKVQTLIIDTGTTAKQVLCSVHKTEDALPSFHTMIVDPSTTDPARTAVLKCIEGMHKVRCYWNNKHQSMSTKSMNIFAFRALFFIDVCAEEAQAS